MHGGRWRVGVAVALIGGLVLSGALPAAADPRPWDPNHTHAGGGSTGNTIWVSVGKSGGARGSYNNCSWQPGWPNSNGPTETRSIPSLVQFVLANWGFAFGDIDDPTATVELVPTSEADLDGDGEIDADFTVPLISDEDDYVIGETDGLNWFEDLILNLVGTHDLGVFQPDTLADSDDLTEDQENGTHYQESGFYPLVQRGIDPFDGTDLWWDPWYVSIADQAPGCPPGVIYSPRYNNPRILLPDLQAFVAELLPPARPIIRPTDSDHGWAYVQVPTNFAVAGSSLQHQSAHAEVMYIDPSGTPSALWAEIEAIPTHLVFDPGDGSDPIVCHISGMGFDPADPGPCSHVYLDSSNTVGGEYETRVSVLWVGLYEDSTGVTSTVNIVPTTATFPLAVGEARPST